MRLLRLLHRWTGGLIGLLLALLGLSGALLAHEDAFLRATLPHAADAQRQDTATLAAMAAKVLAAEDRPRSIVLATERLGLNKLSYNTEDKAAYANQDGKIIQAWTSNGDRPEAWLLDFHHHLFNGDAGEIVGGVRGLAGLALPLRGAPSVVTFWGNPSGGPRRASAAKTRSSLA